MSDEKQTCYLSGPPNLNAFTIMRVRNGEIRGVDINFEDIEHAYRALPWDQFVEQYVEPAFAQLFLE